MQRAHLGKMFLQIEERERDHVSFTTAFPSYKCVHLVQNQTGREATYSNKQ